MSRAAEEYELTIHMMDKDYRELVAKYEGYRKALKQIREMHYYDSSATEMRQIAREALSNAATENPNAGHGWITGTADIDAIEGHAMRESVPEAGEAIKCPTCGSSAVSGEDQYEDAWICPKCIKEIHSPAVTKAMGRFRKRLAEVQELQAAQETIRQLTHKFAEAENTIGELRLVSGEQVETIRQRDQQFEQHTKAVGRFLSDLYCTMIDPLAEGESPVTETMAALLKAAQEQRQHEHDQIELIRQRDEVIQESWEQAREWGNELGISAEHLPALICGIGDKFFELQEQRDAQLERIREYSAGEHRGLDMAAIHEIASESTAPPALCPTCKGTKRVHMDIRFVPCPTCTEPK